MAPLLCAELAAMLPDAARTACVVVVDAAPIEVAVVLAALVEDAEE
jgi:hypothetical protein